MLHYKSVSTEWWVEAVCTPVYITDGSSNTAHPNITPYELAFKMKPQMDYLRVFGSHGYAHIDDVKRTKLEPKSFKCMFLGYAVNVTGNRVFDLENAKIKVICSVKLDEREVGGIDDTQEVMPVRIT
ncbi:polyprotein [Plasmopara halstedii]|uniref:Polyprotein n=1 Tax=Plasmopara halstedii TaxID=4781 RepID=A0A0P1A9A7_PLAHL|nr:polyprotein [Plasmopara halstedii]CEG36660.1 polyprotein [Plasmopara halstedii]|eukprot:XP_024573029.1 polyprotein [Plasmopara halstedii]